MLYAAVFLLDYRRGLGWWDEYSHWAPMAKETFRLNRFYCDPASALTVHRDYPPFVTLFEYLWCKLCGGYDEPLLYRALHMLSFSLFLPATRGFQRLGAGARKWGLVACTLTAGVIVVGSNLIVVEGAFLTSILTDSFLGLILAYCLGTILLDDDRSFFSLFSLCLGLAAMVLTKEIAAYFVGLCAVLLLAVDLPRRRMPGAALGARSLSRTLLRAFAAACVPALFYLSWQYVLVKNGQPGRDVSGGFQLSLLPGILMDATGTLSQRLTAINFKSAVFSQGLGAFPVDMTFLQLLTFFTGLYALFAWANRKDGFSARLVPFGVLVLLGGLGYAFLVMTTYLFFFDPYEAVNLASYSRYMGTYGLAMLAAAVMLLFRQLALWQRERPGRAALRLLLVFCGLVLCVSPALGGGFQPALVSYSLSREYLSDSTRIGALTGESDAVLVVAQGDKGLAGHVLRYELLPRKVESVSLGQPKYDGDVWTQDLSAEAFAQTLAEYDYLYLYQTDDELRERYQALFAPGSAVEDGLLYRVEQGDGGAEPLLRPMDEERNNGE